MAVSPEGDLETMLALCNLRCLYFSAFERLSLWIFAWLIINTKIDLILQSAVKLKAVHVQ